MGRFPATFGHSSSEGFRGDHLQRGRRTMIKIRDLGINFVPATRHPPKMGGGYAMGGDPQGRSHDCDMGPNPPQPVVCDPGGTNPPAPCGTTPLPCAPHSDAGNACDQRSARPKRYADSGLPPEAVSALRQQMQMHLG